MSFTGHGGRQQGAKNKSQSARLEMAHYQSFGLEDIKVTGYADDFSFSFGSIRVTLTKSGLKDLKEKIASAETQMVEAIELREKLKMESIGKPLKL